MRSWRTIRGSAFDGGLHAAYARRRPSRLIGRPLPVSFAKRASRPVANMPHDQSSPAGGYSRERDCIMRRQTIAVICIVTIGFVALAMEPVAAEPSNDGTSAQEENNVGPIPPAPTDPVTATLGELSSGIEGISITAAVSPAGCRGKANDPHPSSHFPTTVNVIGQTICNWPVSQYILVKLWRHRWWGWQFLSEEPDNAWTSKLSQNTWKDCSGTYTYRGTNRHESYEPGGPYVANTESSHRRIRENPTTKRCEWA